MPGIMSLSFSLTYPKFRLIKIYFSKVTFVCPMIDFIVSTVLNSDYGIIYSLKNAWIIFCIV